MKKVCVFLLMFVFTGSLWAQVEIEPEKGKSYSLHVDLSPVKSFLIPNNNRLDYYVGLKKHNGNKALTLGVSSSSYNSALSGSAPTFKSLETIGAFSRQDLHLLVGGEINENIKKFNIYSNASLLFGMSKDVYSFSSYNAEVLENNEEGMLIWDSWDDKVNFIDIGGQLTIGAQYNIYNNISLGAELPLSLYYMHSIKQENDLFRYNLIRFESNLRFILSVGL